MPKRGRPPKIIMYQNNSSGDASSIPKRGRPSKFEISSIQTEPVIAGTKSPDSRLVEDISLEIDSEMSISRANHHVNNFNHQQQHHQQQQQQAPRVNSINHLNNAQRANNNNNSNNNANRPNQQARPHNNTNSNHHQQSRPVQQQSQANRQSQQNTTPQSNNNKPQPQQPNSAQQQPPAQTPAPLPPVLPKGWKKEEVVVTKGIRAGLVDVFYSPNEKSEFATPEIVGKKFKKKTELHKIFGEKYDLALLDFKRGKISQIAYRKYKRNKNLSANPNNYLSQSKYDQYLNLPSRQTASIFKQSVSYVTNNHKNDPTPSYVLNFNNNNNNSNNNNSNGNNNSNATTAATTTTTTTTTTSTTTTTTTNTNTPTTTTTNNNNNSNNNNTTPNNNNTNMNGNSPNPTSSQTDLDKLHQNQKDVLSNKNYTDKAKPIQLFWELHFDNLSPVNSDLVSFEDEIKQDFHIDFVQEFKNFNLSNENILRSVAVSWYLNQNKLIIGQDNKEFMKNPRIFIDREQPIIPAMKIKEEDLKSQENKILEMRKQLQLALEEYENMNEEEVNETDEEMDTKIEIETDKNMTEIDTNSDENLEHPNEEKENLKVIKQEKNQMMLDNDNSLVLKSEN